MGQIFPSWEEFKINNKSFSKKKDTVAQQLHGMTEQISLACVMQWGRLDNQKITFKTNKLTFWSHRLSQR